MDSSETDLSIGGLGDPCHGVVHPRRVGRAGRRGRREAIAAKARTGKIVAVRQGPALATAFHPELTGDQRIHELFINIVRQGS